MSTFKRGYVLDQDAEIREITVRHANGKCWMETCTSRTPRIFKDGDTIFFDVIDAEEKAIHLLQDRLDRLRVIIRERKDILADRIRERNEADSIAQ